MLHPIAAAANAALHRRRPRENGSPVSPMRRLSDRRSSINSTHPPRLADDVSPTVPHIGSMPSIGGSTMAARYPSTVAMPTCTSAYRKGVRVSRSA